MADRHRTRVAGRLMRMRYRHVNKGDRRTALRQLKWRKGNRAA
jgi:hypothetical protein